MTQQKRFKPNSPNVIYEEIDGEVVLVNLETGSYYSIDSIGAVIWNEVEQGQPVGAIVEIIAAQYSGARSKIEQGIRQWVDRLAAENLIVPANGAAPPPPQAAAAANGSHPPFETPNLHKYTDMEDLLLLDPIHDVDESGWPNTTKA